MVYGGKLRPVGAGDVLILDLCPHRRSMLFMTSRQFRGSGAHLQSALPAVEAHTDATAAIIARGTVVNVMHNRYIHIVVGAVVIESPPPPVAPLVADPDIAEAVIDAAIEADMRAPVATVKPIAVIVVAPVAGRPECALVGSLHPSSGNPVVALGPPDPVAGRPQIAVAGSRRLIVIGQGRRRLIGVFDRLRAVAGIVRTLIIGAARIRRSALLGIRSWRRAGVTVRCWLRVAWIGWGQVGRCRVRGLILCADLGGAGGNLVLTLVASDGKKHDRHGNQGHESKSAHIIHSTLQCADANRRVRGHSALY